MLGCRHSWVAGSSRTRRGQYESSRHEMQESSLLVLSGTTETFCFSPSGDPSGRRRLIDRSEPHVFGLRNAEPSTEVLGFYHCISSGRRVALPKMPLTSRFPVEGRIRLQHCVPSLLPCGSI